MVKHGEIFIITGWRGAGKTSLCKTVITQAKRLDWDIAGVLSPAVFEHGEKTGIEIVNLRTGETRLLARSTRFTDSPLKTTGWAFDQKNTEWGNEILRDAASCDLLIVDELGPLELERQQGWLMGIHAIDSGNYRIAMVVIRPELLSIAIQRWPNSQIVNISDPNTAKSTAEKLIQGWLD